MTTIDQDARDMLRYRHAERIPLAEYVRHHFPDGQWRGDTCGCSDDRCIGYHHEAGERCGCVVFLIDDYVAQGRPARRAPFGRTEVTA